MKGMGWDKWFSSLKYLYVYNLKIKKIISCTALPRFAGKPQICDPKETAEGLLPWGRGSILEPWE